MPSRARRRKHYFGIWPPLRMPEEGVFTEDGYLFHHETPVSLNDSHLERLLEYGIQLAHGERFTPEEDQRIRKNWRSFAQKHGFIYEDARSYAGFAQNLESLSQKAARTERSLDEAGNVAAALYVSAYAHAIGPLMIRFVIGQFSELTNSEVDQGDQVDNRNAIGQFTDLTNDEADQLLGRKLEHRSARQIQRRICIIFDPHYVGQPSPLSLDTVLQANEMALQGKSRCEIALSLGISMNRLHNAMYSYKKTLEKQQLNAEEAARDPSILSRKRLSRERYRMLFESVLKRSSLSQARLAALLKRSLEDVQEQLKDFPWTNLVPVFPPLNAEEIEKEWHVLVEELSRSFHSFLEVHDEDEAWKAAMDEVMPCVQFSLRDVIFYIKTLRKCIDRKTTVVHPQYINTAKLSEKLSARGLANKETFDLNKCDIYKRIMVVLRTRNREIFRQLRFPLTSREKLRILENCYHRLQSNSNGDELITALPRLKKPLLIECIIERMHKIDPSWQPPLLFQRWIRSWYHAELYTKNSNNDEIRNDVLDAHFLRKALFEDPTECLYGSSSTARQRYLHGLEKETLDPKLGTSHPQLESAEAGTSFEQDPSVLALTTAENNPNSIEDITETYHKKKRRSMASDAVEEGEHLSVSIPSVPNESNDGQELTYSDDYFKGSSRIESQPDEHDITRVDNAPFDIFGESVDETILAGNIETTSDRAAAEKAAPSGRESSISPSIRQSPEPGTRLEGEDDSFRNLKITIPTAKATPPEKSRGPDVMENGFQGWMKFLQ